MKACEKCNNQWLENYSSVICYYSQIKYSKHWICVPNPHSKHWIYVQKTYSKHWICVPNPVKIRKILIETFSNFELAKTWGDSPNPLKLK